MDARAKIQILQNIVSRKGSSKVLSFSVPHVFKSLQLLHKDGYVSRATFCSKLHMGEGAVKTMISHLKKEAMVDSTKSGTFLTDNGLSLIESLLEIIASECSVAKCDVVPGKHNHAVLLRGYSFATKSGVEQRDYAILYGAIGATTLFYKDGKFVFPNDTADCLLRDPATKQALKNRLHPKDDDMIIIASANEPFVAEIAAANSALWTLATR